MNAQPREHAVSRRSLRIVLVPVLFTAASLFGLDEERSVPFHFEQGRMVVQGSIGRLTGLNLVIDTGATLTVLSEKVARKLRLQQGRAKEANVYGQRVLVREALLPELSLGTVVFESVPVLIADLKVGLSFRVDVLIGMELLKRQPLTLDFRRRLIRFESTNHGPSAFRVNPNVPLVFLYLTVAGSRPLVLMLDTGAEDLILFQQKVQGEIPVVLSPETKAFWGAGGRAIQVRRVFLSEVRMKDTGWARLPAFLLETSESSYRSFDGIVGPLALGLETLSLDFQQGLVSWTR